jgi:hypothetical protein
MLASKIKTAPTTLGDLIRVLANSGVRVDGIGGMTGPRGTISYRRLVRLDDDGARHAAQLPNMDDGDPLAPYVGRSLCVQLKLNPGDYGL